uniref:Uncharacterized protein n=1 Tax=Alexandrium monilatum TaxID=311494 RepID=A0A7S4VUX5_9DINO
MWMAVRFLDLIVVATKRLGGRSGAAEQAQPLHAPDGDAQQQRLRSLHSSGSSVQPRSFFCGSQFDVSLMQQQPWSFPARNMEPAQPQGTSTQMADGTPDVN